MRCIFDASRKAIKNFDSKINDLFEKLLSLQLEYVSQN